MQPAKRTSSRVRARDDGSDAGSGVESDLTSNLVGRRSIDRPNCASPREDSIMFVYGERQKGNRSFDIQSFRRLASSAYFRVGG